MALRIETVAMRAGAALVGIVAGLAATLPAAAQSPLCADLQSQYLDAVGTTPGRTVGVGQSMLDMDKLSRELANAQAAARQGNCNRFLFFGPRPSPQCPAIMAAVGRLQQQLARMRGTRSLFAVSPQQERDRLRGWLMQNGCDVPQAGGLRTICVRTCDGYFFPISFSTGRQNVSRDAAVCQSMYAGDGQAEIYAHTTNTDIANAQSLSGRRYGDQPYAFLFRQAFFSTCEGQLKDGIAALGERYRDARAVLGTQRTRVAAAPEFRFPMPTMRPTQRQDDPETAANRRGLLAVAPYVAEEDRPAVAVAGRAMRQVGDPYYAELFDPTKPTVAPPAHRPPLGFDLIGSALAAVGDFEDDGEAEVTYEIR
jgi:hypothetical protein